MFVDFDKVFKSNEEAKSKIPAALIRYLSRDLPDGFKYEEIDNGICYIVSDKEQMTLSGFEIELTDEQKKILGANYSFSDIFKYFYNAQKTIPLKLNKPNMITINGQEMPVDKMALRPFNPIKVEGTKFFAEPPKFPGNFSIKIGGNGCEMLLSVKRVPNESIHTYSFESSDEKPLKIKYSYNESEHFLTLSMSAQLKNATTVRELLDSMQIYNAYMNGKGTLCGEELKSKLSTKKHKTFPKKTIGFWKKVLELEQCLNRSFVLPYEDIPYEQVCIVEHLYQNLIKHKPIRENQKINSLDGCWNIENEEKIKNSLGNIFMFEFEALHSFELFGIKFSLPSFTCVFNAKLTDYARKDDKYILSINDGSEEEPMYMSMRCFKNEDDLKEFKKRNHNQIVAGFQNAKKAADYIK